MRKAHVKSFLWGVSLLACMVIAGTELAGADALPVGGIDIEIADYSCED